MTATETTLRTALRDVMREMADTGLNQGTAGNASVRCGDGIMVTPSGITAAALTPEQMVLVSPAGTWKGPVAPSSEWRMHLGLLQARPDVHAVVHCHSRFATTLACAHRPIPPLHYMTAITGGPEIRLAPYATFGSAELAAHIVTTLEGRLGCLMANHGQIALGETLEQALAIASEIETQSSWYHGTLAIGGPKVLGEDAMTQVMDAFKSYGQPQS
ncbi:MAG: class II aldolase/adducin family protein [Pseudomonadota bacterium]